MQHQVVALVAPVSVSMLVLGTLRRKKLGQVELVAKAAMPFVVSLPSALKVHKMLGRVEQVAAAEPIWKIHHNIKPYIEYRIQLG